MHIEHESLSAVVRAVCKYFCHLKNTTTLFLCAIDTLSTGTKKNSHKLTTHATKSKK
jgi:hypothetical protein